jgi:hypothetical protein
MASEFVELTVSGMLVTWVPLGIGFVVQHWRIKVYIRRVTRTQTRDVEDITNAQTGKIENLTAAQTAQLSGRRRRAAGP